ncbi:XdhC/CoxI family protein [Paenibacillus sp. Marseille-Q4541]|uniref:XdhC family protein n=1 Tax=Paenibacillus sp. Marseille-Q4541 TaxID=2831522 RepID=UPI001BAD63DD|nr:XdhC/CoxI family protein [Paenibacillus sp. Marseille-Q4541]
MEMHDICEAVLSELGPIVLATTVYVEGHAYRKQGVSMLFTKDGGMIGSLSPGCIETDLALRAEEVLQSGRPQLGLYDMRPEDDLSWGENIGCGGLLHILLEPVKEDLKRHLTLAKSYLDQGYSITIRRVWNEPRRYVQHWIEKRETSFKTEEYSKRKVYPYESKKSDRPVDARSNKEEVYLLHYDPKPRLLIIGAGNDSIPLVKLAANSGFRVTVADWREALCTEERFPDASILIGFPDEIYRSFQIKEQDYVLLMSHQFPKERAFLEKLQHTSYRYLGILGSRTRASRLLEGLPSFPHLHTPVGIKIGSEGPEEIAISIAAELIAVKRKKSKNYDEGEEECSYVDGRDHTRRRPKSAHG